MTHANLTKLSREIITVLHDFYISTQANKWLVKWC